MLDLKRLGHLVALADERHFARAAQRVHLSQPAFSRSIQSLEQELELRLFDRESGDVKPTPGGSFLIERARRLLFEARCLQRDTELLRDSQLGDCAFGAGPFPAETLMPALIARLRREHPGVGLRLEVSNWTLLYQRLLGEDIEFFVADRRDLPADPRIEIMPLGRDRGRLYARPQHPLAGRPCRFHEAWAYGAASPKLPQAMQSLVLRLLGLPADASAPPALECDELALLRRLAQSTDTVIVFTELAAREDLAAGRLVALQVEDLPAEVGAEMGIVLLRQRTPSPTAQRAIAGLRELAAVLGIGPA